jgi:hypothetical protein
MIKITETKLLDEDRREIQPHTLASSPIRWETYRYYVHGLLGNYVNWNMIGMRRTFGDDLERIMNVEDCRPRRVEIIMIAETDVK